MNRQISSVGRRTALKLAAGASALIVGWRSNAQATLQESEAVLSPNPFIRIDSTGLVTVISKHLEMGQGVSTGLATLVAEELDAAWAQVRVELAPLDPARFNNLGWGRMQGTGSSSSIANAYDQMRQAGAAARSVLVSAAAKAWSVPADEVTVSQGTIFHRGTRRSGGFGQFVAIARDIPVPKDVRLKAAADFTLVGKHVRAIGNRAKTDGTAKYTIDVALPGMRTAAILHPPVFGAKPISSNKKEVQSLPGIDLVDTISSGIAVVGTDFWTVLRARDKLRVEWDLSNSEQRGSSEIREEYAKLLDQPGTIVRNEGDVAGSLSSHGDGLVEAEFEFPFLAHAPMEPINCVAQIADGRCEVWAGAQIHSIDQQNIAKASGLSPDQVQIHTMIAGGSFGRRTTPDSDVMVEAVEIARLLGDGRPVKVQWTREDDVRGGRYRPAYTHRLRAAVGRDGIPVAWDHRIVGQSFLTGTPFQGAIKDGIDPTSVKGARDLPYDIPNLRVELHSPKIGVPVLWWRSNGGTHNGFATEVVVDELARKAGVDPVVFRRRLLVKSPRHLAALELVAEKARWFERPSSAKGWGIAVHEAYGSYVAQVVELQDADREGLRIRRVFCAVDCGKVVNPDIVRAQMEGGILYGLEAAMFGSITLKDGRVQQSSFDTYRVLRMSEAPPIEVHIVPSDAPSRGVGEPGTPPIGPALANAYFDATGIRVRRLPMFANG